MTTDRLARIGIVGASCAGLSAAESLRDLGYTDITLLEAKSRPGGKTCSVALGIEGRDVIVEGGTMWYIPGKRFAELVRRAGMENALRDTPPVQLIDVHTGKLTSPFLIDTREPLLRRIWQTLRFIWELRRHGREDTPGFRDPAIRSLGVTSADWFAQNGLPFPRQAFAPVAISTQMGHGEPELAAAYVLKGLAVLNRYPLRRQLTLSLPKFAPSNQELWQRLAARHQVIYRAEIQRIERRADKVTVETAAGAHQFDRLIWAAPTDAFLAVADAGEEEQEVFSRVRTLRRAVITCRVTGVQPGAFHFVKNTLDNGVPVGYPTVMFEVETGSGLHNFYPYMDDSTTLDDMMGHIRDLVRRLGGTAVELARDPLYWTWFPHFSAADVQAGIYERAEALQGKGHTWFANELYAGVSVVYGVEYAHDLVQRFFA